jgi:hypothetical protein
MLRQTYFAILVKFKFNSVNLSSIRYYLYRRYFISIRSIKKINILRCSKSKETAPPSICVIHLQILSEKSPSFVTVRLTGCGSYCITVVNTTVLSPFTSILLHGGHLGSMRLRGSVTITTPPFSLAVSLVFASNFPCHLAKFYPPLATNPFPLSSNNTPHARSLLQLPPETPDATNRGETNKNRLV